MNNLVNGPFRMVGTDFSISARVWKFFRTCRYCYHVIRELKIENHDFICLNFAIFVDFDLVITIKEVPKH